MGAQSLSRIYLMLRALETQLLDALTHGFGGVPVKSLPALEPEALLQLFGAQPPAVWVTPAPMSLEQHRLVLRWEVLLLGRTAGGDPAARVGQPGLMGAYELVWRFLSLSSAGLPLGDEATAYTPGVDWLIGLPAEKLARSGVLCASALLEAVIQPPGPLSADELARLDDLNTLRVDLDIPPHALPADHLALAMDETVPGLPDSRDEVTLDA
jgi:hypothetical protein